MILTVRAIGAKAVFEMLRAVAIARAYLDDDGNGQDLVAFPDFIKVNLEGRDEPTNALRVVVVMTTQDSGGATGFSPSGLDA